MVYYGILQVLCTEGSRKLVIRQFLQEKEVGAEKFVNKALLSIKKTCIIHLCDKKNPVHKRGCGGPIKGACLKRRHVYEAVWPSGCVTEINFG